MEESYAEEEYTFFTDPTNFEMMVDVSRKLSRIRNKIVENFWDDVLAQIKQHLVSPKDDWIVRFSGKYGVQYRKIDVYRRLWEENGKRIISLTIQDLNFSESPKIGITVDAKNTNHDMAQLKNSVIREIDFSSPYLQSQNEYWCFMKYLDFDFKTEESLMEVLPDSDREGKIENVCKEVLFLTELTREKIDSLIPHV